MKVNLPASLCQKCNRAIVPPRLICPYCGPSVKMEPIEVGHEGTIVSYTSLEMPPEGFKPPLTMALVELEHSAHVLCLLDDDSSSLSLQIGQGVRLRLDDTNRLRFTPK